MLWYNQSSNIHLYILIDDNNVLYTYVNLLITMEEV